MHKTHYRDLFDILITVDQVAVPMDNTYWCFVHRLDEIREKSHHMVHFEPIHTHPGLMHHMEVFHCDVAPDTQIPMYSGICDQAPADVMQCNRVIALWALGSIGFSYPPEAGMRIGGPDMNPYVRVEMHYNNAENRSGKWIVLSFSNVKSVPLCSVGLIDNSGMRLRFVRQLRKSDVGIMELGLEYTDKMAIPPGLVAFPLTGFCTPQCTDVVSL